MDKARLQQLQAPLKAQYRTDPASAVATMEARGTLDPEHCVCRLEPRSNSLHAGLHAMAGGNGTHACSGDMLLDALVACAGVTLLAVATALEISLAQGQVTGQGELDFRGTLGVERTAPVGFQSITLTFELDTTATDEQLATLKKLTERYCVVAQSLSTPITITIDRATRHS